MIGNISIATSMQALNNIIALRNQYKVAQYKQRGMTAPRCKVIVIDDFCPKDPDYICGSILLPPPRSMECLIEGNMEMYEYIYHSKFVSDDDVHEYICILLTGLMERDIDYILYADTVNNYNMIPIISTLTQMLSMYYGLIFVGDGDIMNNPNLLFNQSVLPEFVVKDKELIDRYGYSDKAPSLFYQF